MTLGVFVMGLGIAMSKLALLGTTPISTIPAVLSFTTDLTIGTWTIIFNVFLIILEYIILGKKNLRLDTALQMVVAILLGVFTDVGVELFSGIIAPADYLTQWFWCISACIVLSIGVTVEIEAGLLVAPGDGFVMALKLKKPEMPFSRWKVIFDSTNVIIAAILSIMLTGGLNSGVREGTIFAAIAVGLLVGFWRKHIGGVMRKIIE